MSVILTDLSDETHWLKIGNAGWRDTIAVLEPFGILSPEQVARLKVNWVGEQFTESVARLIGDRLINEYVAKITWSEAVYPPDGFWHGLGHDLGEYDVDTQWPSWLRAFAGFCMTCRGFDIC